MSGPGDNTKDGFDVPENFSMKEDYFQGMGLDEFWSMEDDVSSVPNFVELDPELDGQRSIGSSADGLSSELFPQSALYPQSLTYPLPTGLNHALLNRLRDYYRLKLKLGEELDDIKGISSTLGGSYDRPVAASKEIIPAAQEENRQRNAVFDRYDDRLREKGLTRASVNRDINTFKHWLVERGLFYGDQVITGRRTLVQKLTERYLGEEVDGVYQGIPENLADLALGISVIMCFRIGMPVVFTAEMPERNLIPDAYLPAEESPDTKGDLEGFIYNPQFAKDIGEEGLNVAWNWWVDREDHNGSPFVKRFEQLQALFGDGSSDFWKHEVYSLHPVCLFLADHFGSEEKIYVLADLLRSKNTKLRNKALVVFVKRIVDEFTQSITDLEEALKVDPNWVFNILGKKFEGDYVDWGDHTMLLTLAASEAVYGEDDPLYQLISKELIPSLDVKTWTETIQQGLMAIGVLLAIASFGASAGILAAPIFALDWMLAISGAGVASIEVYQAAQQAPQMRREKMVTMVDQHLAGMSLNVNLGSSVGMLVFELLLLVLFPPSKAAINTAKQAAQSKSNASIPGAQQGVKPNAAPAGVAGDGGSAAKAVSEEDQLIHAKGTEGAPGSASRSGKPSLQQMTDKASDTSRKAARRRISDLLDRADSPSKRDMEVNDLLEAADAKYGKSSSGSLSDEAADTRAVEGSRSIERNRGQAMGREATDAPPRTIKEVLNRVDGISETDRIVEELLTHVDVRYPLVPLRNTQSLDEIVEATADVERMADDAIRITDEGLVDLSSLPARSERLARAEVAQEIADLTVLLNDIPVVRAEYAAYRAGTDNPKSLISWVRTARRESVVLEMRRRFSLDYMVMLREVDYLRGSMRVSERMGLLQRSRQAIEESARNNPFPGSFDEVVDSAVRKEAVWIKNTRHLADEFGLESIAQDGLMRQIHDEALGALRNSNSANDVTRWFDHLNEINRTVTNVPHAQMVDRDLLKKAWKAYRDRFRQVYIAHHGPNGAYHYARNVGDIHHMRLKSLNPYHMLDARNLFILPPVTERSMKHHLMLHYVISGGEGFSTALPRMNK